MNTSEKDVYSPHGHFLYADYTPLEDDRNVIEMLKAFVSISSGLIKLHESNESLSAALSDSDSLRESITSAIKQIKTSTTSSIENFRNRHSEALASDLHADGTILLSKAQTTLLELLSNTETSFAQIHQKYKESVTSKIKENEDKAVELVHEWLSKDYANLPRPVLANLISITTASLNTGKSLEQYSINRTASTVLPKVEEGSEPPKYVSRFSYTTRIDAKELEFWNYKRRVSELGIKDLMLPIGMKAPMTEKLKQTFKFGQKDSELLKEPDSRKVEDYYIVHAELQGQTTLTLQLAVDPSKLDASLFKITYNVEALSELHTHSQSSGTSPLIHRPRIDYRATDNAQISETSDLLQIAELERASDLSKIKLLGTAVLSKMSVLTDPATIASRGQLYSLLTDDGDIIKADRLQNVDFARLFRFISLIASALQPTVKKLKEKTPMKDELILRQEMPDGHRKEFTIRLDDLRSQLADAQYGRPILNAMGI